MKNLLPITLIVLFFLLMGVVASSFRNSDVEKLPRYLPAIISTQNQQLALFQTNAVPTAKTILIGPSEAEEVPFDIVSTQGQYLNEDRRLTLTVSVEEINKNDYELYKEKTWQRYTAPSRGGTSTQKVIRDHDVYLSFRTIAEGEDTSNMVVLGGGYVFFPEENVAVTYSLLNPRLYACDDIWKPETCSYDEIIMLPSIGDAETAATQILDTYYLAQQ